MVSEIATDELLSQDDVSKLLKVTKETLANYRSDGKGPRFVKAVGKVHYRKSDVWAFIEQSVKRSTSDTQEVA